MSNERSIDSLVRGIGTLLQSAGKDAPTKARVVGFWGEQISALCDEVLQRQSEITDANLRREVLTVLARLDRNLDHPPTDQSSEAITHYPGFQRARDCCADDLLDLADRIAGEQWNDSVEQRRAGGGEGKSHQGGYLSPHDLADVANLPTERIEALRKALERWRKNHDDGWTENQEAGPRDPRFLYRQNAVQHVIEGVRKRTQLSSERPAEKN